MAERPNFSQENRRLHDLRQWQLIEYGIVELIIRYGDCARIGGQTSGLDFRFTGGPIARVKAQRAKQGDGIFYGERIEVSYDGTILSVDGAHPIYQGPIQTEDNTVSDAIREAWDNPERTVITDFNPRKSVY